MASLYAPSKCFRSIRGGTCRTQTVHGTRTLPVTSLHKRSVASANDVVTYKDDMETTSELPVLTRRAVLLSLNSIALMATGAWPAHAAVDHQGIDKVFVAGSTGNTGRRVVQQLRAQGFKVRAGTRDIKKAQSLGFGLDPEIELVKADVTAGADSLIPAIGDAQAVIVATGYTGFNPGGFGQVDEVGNKNLVDAAKAAGVKHFVLMSSLLTNAPAVGQKDNPNYRFLNLFGGVLDHKLVAEKYLKSSGLTYTIVRPGGLSNEPADKIGQLVVGQEDTLFGLQDDPGRQISRDTVAEVLVAAILQPSADNRVVEVVASPSAPALAQDTCTIDSSATAYSAISISTVVGYSPSMFTHYSKAWWLCLAVS
eukprot:jgi/Chrzof1/11511/UNPLg00445.t1